MTATLTPPSVTLPHGYGAAISEHNLTRLGNLLAEAARTHLADDDSDVCSWLFWREIGATRPEQRSDLLFDALRHVEVEWDVRNAADTDDLIRLTGYGWDGDFEQQREQAYAHAQAETVAHCIAAVWEVTA